MNAISIIGCVVGIVGCVIGVATFVSGIISRSKQDGQMIAKIDYACKGIDEIKADMKDKNKEIDETISEHSKQLAEHEERIKTLFNEVNELKGSKC